MPRARGGLGPSLERQQGGHRAYAAGQGKSRDAHGLLVQEQAHLHEETQQDHRPRIPDIMGFKQFDDQQARQQGDAWLLAEQALELDGHQGDKAHGQREQQDAVGQTVALI